MCEWWRRKEKNWPEGKSWDIFRSSGAGLGWAIVQRLVIRMGENIRVENVLGQGGTFVIELPGTAVAEPVSPLASAAPGHYIDEKKLQVLVVDDVAMNRKVLAAMLRKLQMAPIVAEAGREALDILQRTRPDLVLTDLWMPEMNGDVLAAAIHGLAGCADLSIVAVTADTEAKENFNTEHFYDILLKPVNLEKLENMFARLREEHLIAS